MTRRESSEPSDGAGTARDSLTIGLWTAVGRVTGVLRVLMIGAVLGPTFFANSYQLTNTLPNLVFYGFLAGSLLSSLVVPTLVRHIDSGSSQDTARVSGGFLGVALVALTPTVPLAVLVLPEVLRWARPGLATGQTRLLVLMAVPQVFLYAVVASATAVMFAHRRYAIAAAAPSIENIATILVLGAVAVRYGSGGGAGAAGPVPSGELLLLGVGSTAAVVLHAGVQWWGARHYGVTLRPQAGWRDPEVRAIIRRAARSLLQSGLLAVQVLVLLVLGSRVAGGTVAMQISLNFYHLPLALAAAPVGLALLPRLSRLRGDDRGEQEFGESFARALGLALFLVVPAAAGYVVLADLLARTVAAGRMADGAGVHMITWSLAGLSVGLVGETVFVVCTQTAYARDDAGSPLTSMALQCGLCLALCVPAGLVAGERVVALLGGAFALASTVGGLHLFSTVRRRHAPRAPRVWPSVLRVAVATVVMAPVARGAAVLVESRVDGRPGVVLAVVAGSLAGAAAYLLTGRLLGSPELGWLLAGVRSRSDVAVEEAPA